MQRTFLFLQGPSTPFFSQLANWLIARKHKVYKINFCAGDALYWRKKTAFSFRAKSETLESFIEEKYRLLGITDLVLFGDRRPVHRVAIENSKAFGIRLHVFEEGYFRPFWITLERDGVNAHSPLPHDPKWFLEAAAHIPKQNGIVHFDSPFRNRAFHDVLYHFAGMFNPLLYPHYKTHAPTTAFTEYLGYLKRFPLVGLIKKSEKKKIDSLVASKVPYYVFPLQLNSDAQIRDHSCFSDMIEAINYVMDSFAKHAPKDSFLVIKNHPLDMGLVPYAKTISSLAQQYGLQERVHYFETGNILYLIQNAQGVVTVNSTSGIVALKNGIQTISLSNSIYNIAGLTSQSTLDQFWNEQSPPNKNLFESFRPVVLYAAQINGGFYCNKSIQIAVENAGCILTSEKSPLEVLL